MHLTFDTEFYILLDAIDDICLFSNFQKIGGK